MMCDFEQRGSGRIACRKCGRQVATAERPERVRAMCRAAPREAGQPGAAAQIPRDMPPRGTCLHQGPELRRELCPSCRGHVELRIFGCALHGECTLGKPHRVMRCCASCPDHSAAEPAAPAAAAVSAPVPSPRARPITEESQCPSPAAPRRAGARAPLRVGLLTPTLASGGAERWWLSLCRHLADDGEIAIAGAALSDYAVSDAHIVAEARRYAPVWGSRILSTTGRDAGNVDRVGDGIDAAKQLCERCDVLISWGDQHPGKYVAGAGFRGPLILLSHGSGIWTIRCLETAVAELQALGNPLRFAAVARAAVGGFPESVRDRVSVVLNGIDLDRAAPSRPREEIRAEWRVAPDQLALGFVGRFSPEKNPLAAAWAASRIDNAVCVYAGAHFDRPTFQAEIVAAAGAREKCRFVVLPHVGDVYAGLDCLVAASREEGCSLTILEAFAAGCPVVATPVGAISELEEAHGPLVTRVAPGASQAELSAAARLAILSRQIEPLDDPRAVRINGDPRETQRIAWEHFGACRMAREWKRFLLAGS